MHDSFKRLGKILRVEPAALFNLSEKLSLIAGKSGVIEKIAEENESLVGKALSEFGLSKENSAEEVRGALQERIMNLDKKLPDDWEALCKTALDLVKGSPSTTSGQSQTTGFFIKREKAVELLEKYPPQNLLDFFGYKSVRELIDKESFESVFAALRFTQNTEWMHKFFDEAYDGLKADDFEERPIQMKVLEEKWLAAAGKFLEKKYHNVSHLKEFGIIFVIPLKLDTPGEALRVFTLLLHYLNEVPFYSKLFRKFAAEGNFVENLRSLLRGDVLDMSKVESLKSKANWLIIQRYLAKDDENDPRLAMPHVNPEAEHWYKAEESLAKLGPDFANWPGSRISESGSAAKKFRRESGISLPGWKELDFVGDFFKGNPSTNTQDNQSELVSFDLVDAVMTLVNKGQVRSMNSGQAKYLYHQQEALWNKIFIEYFGRDKMNELIEENIIKGYISL